MAGSVFPFFHLPGEIRNMIYDHLTVDVEYVNPGLRTLVHDGQITRRSALSPSTTIRGLASHTRLVSKRFKDEAEAQTSHTLKSVSLTIHRMQNIGWRPKQLKRRGCTEERH